jgi:T5SS/PEP-CTERM-associated repeat protein/autotransporter-associated beta strand protein
MHSARGQNTCARSNIHSTEPVPLSISRIPSSKGLLLLATTALTATLGAGAAQAACTANFCWDASSGTWSTGANWTPGGGPPTSANSVLIGNGGTAIVDATNAQSSTAGIDGNSSVVISPGGTWTATGSVTIGDATGSGTLTVNGGTLSANGQHLAIGFFGSSTSSMLIENGGVVTTTGGAQIGPTGGNSSIGLVTVTGSGSTWNLGSANLDMENPGTTTGVTVENGARLISGEAFIGAAGPAGSNNNVLITGPGTTWQSSTIVLGNFTGAGAGSGTGTLDITNGAQVTAGGKTASVVIGFSADGGNGRMDAVTVDGSGSTLTATAAIYVGYGGTGALTVSNGGEVVSSSAIIIGHFAGSTGTLNIGAAAGQAAVAPGTISAPAIQFGTGGGTVVFNHTSSAYMFGTPIEGAGAVYVENGTTILTATNTYTGATTINGGTLDVAGAITGSSGVAVNAGGTLMGPGSITAPVAINSGGTFAPGVSGVSGSATTITGNLAFQSGALYAIALNPVGATMANVSGAASLAGTVEVSLAPGASLSKFSFFDILHSGGLGGTTFGGGALSPNLVASLSYSATDVFLNVTTAQLGRSTTLNTNQQNAVGAINNFFNGGGTLPPAFVALFGLTGNSLGNALTQASGELATGSQQATFDAMNLFMGLLTDPFAAGRGGSPASGASAPTGYASTQTSSAARDAYAMFTKAPLASTYDPHWSVWSAGYGGSQTTDGNAALGSNNTTSSVFGTAIGADYLLSPRTIMGFALAGGGTNFSVAGSGSGHSDLFQAGAFIRHTVGAAYVSAALAYGWQDITTNRTVNIAGTDQLRAQFNANAFSGRLEGGYRFVAPWIGGVGITPYAAAQFTTFDLPAYAEQAVVGSNAFALGYNAKDVTDSRSELGVRADKSFAMIDGILTLRGRLAWAHDYDPDRSIAAAFQTLPGASFVVNGAAQASDSALVTASVEKKWLSGWSAAATFEGEFSDVTSSYAGKGVVRYQW